MSVPKSRRGESPAEYIDLARKIYVFTYDRVKILPKSHTFYFSLPLYNAAREAYRLVKTANLIYIHNDRDKQNRKELFERAQGYYNSMLDTLDLPILQLKLIILCVLHAISAILVYTNLLSIIVMVIIDHHHLQKIRVVFLHVLQFDKGGKCLICMK